MTHSAYDFIVGFLLTFRVNLEVGFYSLLGGILAGLPLTWLRIKGGWAGKAAEKLIALIRAFPVFVLMFLFFNIFSETLHEKSINIANVVLILALCAYATAVISDAALDSWQNIYKGDFNNALLIIPNIFRILTILIMSSSIGAAIGVQDSVSYTLIAIEKMADPVDRIITVFLVTLFFMTLFTVIRFFLYKLTRRISKIEHQYRKSN